MRILTFILLALTLAVVPPGAQAQSAPQSHILIDEDDAWRVHSGDSPAYAASAFDDSSWRPGGFSQQYVAGPVLQGSSRWFRKRIALPARPGPIDLLLIGDTGSYEVYVDGQRVSPPIQSSFRWFKNQVSVFPLRSASDQDRTQVEVAIRSHLAYTEFFSYINFRFAAAGDPTAIAYTAAADRGNLLGLSVFSSAILVLTLIVGLLLLSFHLQQRRHREYLWLGVTILLLGISVSIPYMDRSGTVQTSLDCFFGDPCCYFFIAAQLEFIYAFTGRKPGTLLRLYQALLVLTPALLNPLLWTGFFPDGTLEWVEGLATLPGIVVAIFLLLLWYRRGSREAGLLLLPILLANAGNLLDNVEYHISLAHPSFAFPIPVLGGVSLLYAPLLAIPFLISIGFLIFHRFTQISRDQAQSEADLESARTIQQILIPETLLNIPGFHIESVYHPAQQVGGDFFQILPLDGGGVLAVIGDVSGKGLAAALNVALIVGTFRTLAERTTDPAEILAGLNRRLLGRSKGFTTALALRILPDGHAAFACAGHLNPYLNGSEVALDAGLPLGLILDAVYESTSIALAPNDFLAALTDGVLEARDPKTQELFGFDRTLAISAQSAHRIAETAQAFGQEDDIAVLTLQLIP